MKIANHQQMIVRYQPQDPMTTAPVDLMVAAAPGLKNERISVQDIVDTARPNQEGNFLYSAGTTEFQQANSFVVANRTLDMFEKALGHKIPWAFQGDLKLHPHFGSGFNAFYLRQDHSLNFFDGFDEKMGKTISGSESLDVVSHETGHAILDGLKPGLMGWFGSGEAGAFHESFGDMTAMLTALQDAGVLDRVCAETGGDLHKPNVVARLAEEMSKGINNTHLGGTRPDDWVMRDANNDFIYLKPETLPEHAPPEALAAEPHSFGRIFTGAFWDILADINDRFRQEGQEPRQALESSRDVMTKLLARAVELGPNRLNRLSQMSQALIKADERYFQSQFADIIHLGLKGRNLLPEIGIDEPQCQLGKTPGNLQEAEELGRAVSPELKAEALWKNDQGETFIRYGAVREVDLDEHTCTDLAASLTLGIDEQSRLFHSLWEPVDAQSIELARREVEFCRKRPASFASDVERGYRSQVTRGREKLIRIPRSTFRQQSDEARHSDFTKRRHHLPILTW